MKFVHSTFRSSQICSNKDQLIHKNRYFQWISSAKMILIACYCPFLMSSFMVIHSYQQTETRIYIKLILFLNLHFILHLNLYVFYYKHIIFVKFPARTIGDFPIIVIYILKITTISAPANFHRFFYDLPTILPYEFDQVIHFIF